MAGTNDFKAFATDANANVTSQEEWETLTALKKGFSSGKASSAQVSKALRQPSTMAAVLGQFIANAELDALDDGDVDGLVAKLATAITTNLGLGASAFGLQNIVVFNTPGVSNWNVPEALQQGRKCQVTVIGGGASGGATTDTTKRGGGGGGGGYSKLLLDLTDVSSVTVTVGSAGAGVTTGNGASGGSSSFGSYLSATGGQYGYGGTSTSGGSSGDGFGGDVNQGLGWGDDGSANSANCGGNGGGPGGRGSTGVGLDATGYGGGGGGIAANSSNKSGSGKNGIVIIEW